ncbi:uncharacterized protein [Linepithema humile]|uniref:uncharacterized protein n=1 Tax=Linepithema humile TaxID=83485 RepID=UPI00351DAF4F
MTQLALQTDAFVANLTAKDRLTNLMVFLGREVESEERIQMAKTCFESNDVQRSKNKKKKKAKGDQDQKVATATGLLSIKESRSQRCLFCGENHNSSSCEKARNMDIDERMKIVKDKNGCFKCLKIEHSYKKCHSKTKCPWCSKEHCLLMCRNLSSKNKSKRVDEEKSSEQAFNEGHSYLANVSSNKSFLPILKVKMRGPKDLVNVRAVIDTGSHRSYVLEKVIKNLGYETVSEQTMIHLLFEGAKTKPQKHKTCRIYVGNLDGTYTCDFVALEQDIICQDIPSVSSSPWIDMLKEKNLFLSDTDGNRESVSLLIGADVAGKIITGRILQISQGITALKTKLENITREARQVEIKALFQETTEINDEGRYEVLLPWKDNHPPLQDNRNIAERRFNVTKRLQQKDLFDNYNTIFFNWLAESIIERVPASEITKKSYYLPHRPVIKRKRTTKIRPVFDASAESSDSPSLNQCLETGPNLIELIPTLLHRFCERKVGVTADIAKAFLQINISSSERDVLRFL